MDGAFPNEGHFPSSLMNSPFMWPYLNKPDGQPLDVGAVRDSTAVFDPQSGFAMTPQGPLNMLAILRHQFPFIPIVPFPNQIVTVALVQNVPQDIRIPDGVAAVQFCGSGAYYVSNNGNAEIPVAGNQDMSRSLYKPERHMFFTAGIRTFSLISSDPSCVVTIMGYVPTELPR